jgi:hypothetical protein
MNWFSENLAQSNKNPKYENGALFLKRKLLNLIVLRVWCTSMVLAKKTQLSGSILLSNIA